MNQHNSRIADVDEIKTLKETLLKINDTNPALYERMMSWIPNPDDRQRFDGIMTEIEEFMRREAIVKGKMTELREAQKRKNEYHDDSE